MGKRHRPLTDSRIVTRALQALQRGTLPTGGGHAAQLLEEMDNVGHVCPEHASKPGGFAGTDALSFVGGHVMLCFPTAAGGTEGMWLYVDRVEGGELIGTLKNEPTQRLDPSLGDLHFDDGVAFTVDEIAKFSPPDPERPQA